MVEARRALLVDDHAEDRDFVRRMLRSEFPRLEVLEAEDAASYDRAVGAADLDLVITDHPLRWADSLRLLKDLKARRPELPVVMFASDESEEVALSAIQSGLDDYVVKAPGSLDRLAGAIRSVLEPSRERLAIRKAEAHYRSLFEGVPVGVYRSSPSGEILDANPALVQLLGYPDRTPLLGQNVDLWYVDPADRSRRAALMKSEGVLRGFETRIRRLDGTTLWVRESARAVRDLDAGVTHHEGVIEDVTERRQAEQALREREEQLRQAHKMEAVGRLAGGVAHDFNNILTAIAGYSELLLNRLAPAGPEHGHVDEIRKAADRATSLTRQLLAFSRKQVLQPKVVDLNAVVTDMERMLRRLIGEHMDLAVRLDPALGRVRVDPGQIEQVLLNLVLNARDAMPEGGRLTLETRNADLDAGYARTHPVVRPGRYVLLAVTDTGVGMSEEVRSHIFEPFFTTKETGKGTGLGLSTVYGVVKQSGGYIWVYSEPGQGTTFKIYLPLVEDALEPAGAGPARRPTARGRETLLLVEDSDMIRKLLTEVLRQNGYHVLAAADGRSALALAREHEGPLHLLVTDLVMPGMGGRELAAQLTSNRPALPVLYMSGYAEDAVVHHGRLDRASAFLSKPFSPDVLIHRVREILDAAPAVPRPQPR